MPELIAKSALEGRSLTIGAVTLTEAGVGPITSIAVFPDGARPVARALKPLGLAMPAPNECLVKGAARIFWTGRDQAFLIGVAAPAMTGAALTDQTDGWTALSVSGAGEGTGAGAGAGAVDVLARLLPVDLRLAAFPAGQVRRCPLRHMNAVILRTGDAAFEILVFRSMARTAWHEVEDAMHGVAARAGLTI